ncbi:MAG: cellulase family glycosylhydrolase [Bacteroidota bacterium]
MWKTLYCLAIAVLLSSLAVAQPIIYNDATTLITGTWNQNGTLTETSSADPYEGSNHYHFSYNFTGFWAGIGLNLANWGPNGYDFTGYTHLRLAYRGMNGDHRITLMLRSDAGDGNTLTLGTASSSYEVIDVPLFSFSAGTELEISSITELDVSVSSDVANGSGDLYFDDIQLVNIGSVGGTSTATQQRAASMQRGMNLSNWLEAYWLIPSGSYPDTDRYDAGDVAAFRALGIDALRLPVTFEHLAGPAPNYTLDTSNPAFGLIDNAIDWAANNNMKLIIDMHHGITTLTDVNYQTELPRLVAIWEQIINLYGDLDPERYLFEVYNEPHAISNANFRIVAQTLVDVIRDAGYTHSVIVGASGYNGAGELLTFTPLDDTDIIYTFHFYDPYLFTHQQMSWTTTPYLPVRPFPTGSDEVDVSTLINGAGEWSAFYNAPVVVGEFGVTNEAAEISRCNWIELVAELFNNNGFPWFYWGATDISDGFGFFDGGVVGEDEMVPCFGTALGLPAIILPVEELSDVTIQCQGDRIYLEWFVKSDELGSMYVEGFSVEQKNWESLTTIPMRATEQWYRAIMEEQHQAYRIRVVELDGTVHYTRLAENHCLSSEDWKIYPNPSNGQVYLEHPEIRSDVSVQLRNTFGQLIWESPQIIVNNGSPISLPEVATGIYNIQIWQSGRQLAAKRLLIQN